MLKLENISKCFSFELLLIIWPTQERLNQRVWWWTMVKIMTTVDRALPWTSLPDSIRDLVERPRLTVKITKASKFVVNVDDKMNILFTWTSFIDCCSPLFHCSAIIRRCINVKMMRTNGRLRKTRVIMMTNGDKMTTNIDGDGWRFCPELSSCD